MTNQDKLYNFAVSKLGVDASPKDTAPDYYACAESVHDVVLNALGWHIGGGNSTFEQYKALLNDDRFQRQTNYEYGCIITSPTGMGNGTLKNGHTGICGKNRILSNRSASGKWEQYFTKKTWEDYYLGYGGFPVIYFKPLN